MGAEVATALPEMQFTVPPDLEMFGPAYRGRCRDGMRLAALEFYWEHRDAIQVRLLADSFGDEIAAAGRSDEYLIGRCEQIKARFEAIRQRYPELAQALTEGLALLAFEGSYIQ